jgi:hypothetical protein
MLKHYSHIRMEAKPTALESIVQKQAPQPAEPEQDRAPVTTVTQQIEGQYPQKSHSLVILERYVDGRWIVNDEKNWLRKCGEVRTDSHERPRSRWSQMVPGGSLLEKSRDVIPSPLK